jgi:hypothetical protein
MRAMANSALSGERERLAALYELEGDVLEQLAHDPDASVRSAALMQPTATTELLEEVVRRHPEHESQVVYHLHAPIYLLERLPIAHATAPSQLLRYLTAKGATSEEIEQMAAIQAREARAHRYELTLGMVWRQVHAL